MSKSHKKKAPKRVLALPDLEHAKTAVLNSLTSVSGQRTYDHAIREFVAWYCSEPRLAFNRTVVLRCRIHLEQLKYAPATINLRLAAVQRFAYEAADAGLLSPELAAGIRRVVSGRTAANASDRRTLTGRRSKRPGRLRMTRPLYCTGYTLTSMMPGLPLAAARFRVASTADRHEHEIVCPQRARRANVHLWRSVHAIASTSAVERFIPCGAQPSGRLVSRDEPG